MNKEMDSRIKKAKLTATEAKIAEYISRHYYNVCLTSALELGRLIGTSDASVIRTARKLGFAGYSDMQSFITDFMKEDIRRNGGISNMPPSTRFDKKRSVILSENLYEQMLCSMQENLESIFSRNNLQAFEQASDLILSANRKYIAGFRGSVSVVHILRSLGDVFSDVRIIDEAESSALETILDITQEDCLILSSFPRYAEMAITILEIAISKGVKVVVLTDKITAPVCKKADVALLSSVDGMTINNSYVAPVALAEMLVATLYRSIGDEQRAKMKALETYIARHGLY